MEPAFKKSFDRIHAWQTQHGMEDANVHLENQNSFKSLEGRLDTVESSLSTLPDEKKIEEIIRKVLLEVLFSTGRWTKYGLVTTASVVIALGIITGGFKWLLALFGFAVLTK